jgi:hypothetical protein
MPFYGWLVIGILIGPWVWMLAFWAVMKVLDWVTEVR